MLEVEKLPKGLKIIQNPCHPFTFDGPDAIVYDHNGLLGLFVIRKNEITSPHKFFSRVTNTILVYPAHMKQLLVINNQMFISNDIRQLSSWYFNETIEYSDFKRLRAIIEDKKIDKYIRDIKRAQKQIFRLNSKVFNNNLIYIKGLKVSKKKVIESNNFVEKVKYYDRISQKDVVVRANIYRHEDRIYGIKKLANHYSNPNSLQPFFEFVINSEISVDTGVPYIQSISNKVLNLDRLPLINYDPLKPTRIASMFGWHLVISDDFIQVSNRIKNNK